MALEQFTFDKMLTMDSERVGKALARVLSKLQADMADRPDDKGARVLSLKVSMKPVSERGDLESVDVEFIIDDKLPPMRSRNYNMLARARDGEMLVNEASPEDAAQTTIDEVEVTEDGPRVKPRLVATGGGA